MEFSHQDYYCFGYFRDKIYVYEAVKLDVRLGKSKWRCNGKTCVLVTEQLFDASDNWSLMSDVWISVMIVQSAMHSAIFKVLLCICQQIWHIGLVDKAKHNLVVYCKVYVTKVLQTIIPSVYDVWL